MNRPGKRPRRGSTADRASVDTNASFASSASSTQGQAKRLKKDDGSLDTSGSLPGTSKDSQPPSPNSMDLVEELFTAVVQHVDEKGRQLSAEFGLLPSRKDNEDHYATVKTPVDLKQIAMRIQKGSYGNLDALVSDLLLMTDNALDYNKSSSQLHKDAALMKKFILTKRNEYEQRELHRTAERTVRTRRSVAQTTQPLSAVYAALEYGDEETALAVVSSSAAAGEEEVAMEADSDEESHDTAPSVGGKQDKDDEKTMAMYEILDGVVKLKGPGGRIMSGPFMKLPSKRKYKDYYDIIRNPVSLTNIRTKIKNGLYLALDEIILDLRLMCQNAQKFNEGTSGIYRDSVRIEKFVESRQTEYLAALDKLSTPLRTSLSERLLPEYDDYAARRRAKYIVRAILESKNTEGYPAETFLEKPSKKEYKDYYSIIPSPIDLKTIVNKVIGDKHVSEEALMEDIKLMCSNAKIYNREDSDIHRDALLFEELVKKAQRTMNLLCPLEAEISPAHSPVRRSTSTTRRTQSFRAPTTPLQAALMELYEYVVNYTSGDGAGRYLAEFFQTLPAKVEMPSYYEVIKKPIDLDKIHHRIQNEQYANFEEAIDDFGQMFENAAAFNEPTSDIYRDALVLLNGGMQKAKELGAFASVVPDVRQKVQEILHALMNSVLTFEKDGRNLSDTIADCTFSESDSESEASRDSKSTSGALTLETIKANVDSGRYRRLDRFQDDMFELLEKARFTAQPDTLTYEDAVSLHVRFIEKRDELCGPSGEKLFTPALQFTVRQFQSSIDMERKEARSRPLAVSQEPAAAPAPQQAGPCVVGANNEAFFVGDFVYLAPYSADGKQPMIVCVQEIVTGEGGALQVRGCYMLRPQETVHEASRRFYEKEVLQSDWVESHAPTRIIGRCYVLEGKDYFKMAPVGLADGRDVYVCDTSYNTKEETFKKIKKWTLPANGRLQLVKRERPLAAVRAGLNEMKPDEPSTSKVDLVEIEDKAIKTEYQLCPDDQVIDVVREMVLARSSLPQEGQIYYEQKAATSGYIKIGDCFAVMKDDKETHLIKIDKIFDKEDVTFVSGISFLFTKDIPSHLLLPAKLFYHNEVFQKVSEIDEAWPVTSLGARCAVLTSRDFATCRPTEIPEERVYIVESKILENGMLAKGNKSKRLLNVSHTGLSHATNDEILFFDKNINPHKVVSPTLEAALSGKIVEVDRTPEESPAMGYELDDEDTHSMIASEITDQTPLSPTASTVDLGSVSKKRRRTGASTPDAATTPSGKRSPAKKTKYTVSGFILYGAENRKSVKDQFPNLSFQDTSRHVSDMWKNLAPSERKRWEDIARQKCNFVNTELKSRGLATGMTFKGLGSMDESAIIAELEKRVQQQDSVNKANAELAKAAKEGPFPSTSASSVPSTSLPSTSTPSASQPGGITSGYSVNPQTIALLQAQQQHFQRQMQLQQQQFQQERQSQQAQQRSLFLTLPTEPPKVKKAIHTNVFLKYLEDNGMSGSGQKPAIPAWRRQMTATQHNTPAPQQLPDFWPTLLNVDAETKNKGMETLNRMWATRNFILTKTCGLQPATLMANAPLSVVGPTTAMASQHASSNQPIVAPSPPPILSRSNSARKPVSSRR